MPNCRFEMPVGLKYICRNKKYLQYDSMLTKNLSSSEITLKKQSKTIYLNFIAQQQAVQEGCVGQVKIQSGSGANNPSSQIINLLEGAINTTTTERDEQLSTACPILSIPPAIVIQTIVINFLLIAAGGSGGGGGGAGGGGAGGILAGLFSSAVNAISYTLTVGNYNTGTQVGTQGGKAGGDTVFSGGLLTTKTAVGGGGGGGWNDNLSGGSGGSGGGGGGRGGGFQTSGGTGTTAQGNNGGGSSATQNGCGGGGGAGGAGSAGTASGGAGGVGTSTYSTLLSTITASGTTVGVNSGGTYYIGGGGGGAGLTGGQPGAGAAGGLGGGGNGSPDYGNSTPGAANTGGGGGGGGTTGDTDSYGGTGLGIVYYTNATQIGTGGTVTSSGSEDSKIWYHVFTTTGTNTFVF